MGKKPMSNTALNYPHVMRLNDFEYEHFENMYKKYVKKFNPLNSTYTKPSRPLFIRQALDYWHEHGQYLGFSHYYAPIDSYVQNRDHLISFRLNIYEEKIFQNMLFEPRRLAIRDLVLFAIRSFAAVDFLTQEECDEGVDVVDELDE